MSNSTKVANPYLDAVLEIDPDVLSGDSWLRIPKRTNIVENRWSLCRKYAWAIPNEQAIERIVALSPIVEVCAGNGYWASLLRTAGADVVASDIKPGKSDWCKGQLYTHVVKADAEAFVKLHQDRTLMLCWPPCSDDTAYRTLQAYRGSTVIYIGEDYGGCCATDEFFDLLGQQFDEGEPLSIPQHWGLHDYLTVYTRKPERAVIVGTGALT